MIRGSVDARDALAVLATVAGVGALAVLLVVPVEWVPAGVGVRPVLWLFGVAAVCVAGWLVRDLIVPPPRHGSRVGDDPRREWDAPLVDDDPEAIELGDDRPLGDAITVAAGDDDRLSSERGPRPVVARARARRHLHDAAIHAVATAESVDESTAERRVDRGEWTDDVRAAAYLSETATPSIPPTTRLRDWLAGERTARCVRATVRELERLDRRARRGHRPNERNRRAISDERTDDAATAGASSTDTGWDSADDDNTDDDRTTYGERVYPKPATEATEVSR
ncbi:DUF7269 family protein [Halobaculum marinum]|uniref:Uncharacterized protein n=1 Tax=Halobaculum marinum TaxID=3031996 RepID=A0ABD5X1Q9_9EURY|nr:hypothetical protein [Halobaculum sp. DT55]